MNMLLRQKGSGGYLLIEVVIAGVILATATAGMMGVFHLSERKAMYSILQNRATIILRNEVEMVIDSPYDMINTTNRPTVTLLKPNPDAPDTSAYMMEVDWQVFTFPNSSAQIEPRFKVVNVRGIWSFRGVSRTNIMQTVAIP